MHRLNLKAWAAAVLWLVCAASGWARPQSEYLPETTVSLGDVPQGALLEHRFAVRNPGQSVLQLRIASLSHPGLKVRMPQEVSPGAMAWITFTWDTRLVQGSTTVEALLRINETATAQLSLHASVIPPIEVLPYPAVFLSGFRDENATRTLEIVNHDSAPMNIQKISHDETLPKGYSVSLKSLEPGYRYQLDVILTHAAPPGRSQDLLLLRTDSPRSPLIRLPINLFVKEDVYINPESVDFGQVFGDAKNQESFLLKARQGTLRVLAVTADLPFLKITDHDPESFASTHEFIVEIQGNPPKGVFSGSIEITTNDPLFPKVKAPVQGEVVR